jgi:MerR family glutamine synthetase transcriptional repressor
MPTNITSSTRYTLAMVMESTGLSARQIRYYDKIGLVSPERSSGNQRLYAPSDLAILQDIAGLKHKGYSLGRIRSVLTARRAVKGRYTAANSLDEDDAALQNALLYFKGGRQGS